MKRILKHTILVIVVISMLIVGSLCTVNASAVQASGLCGENLTWSFDTSTGELIIAGSGAIYDWESYSKVPWANYSGYISKITIDSRVTEIGNESFRGCSGITEINIPDAVTRIGMYAFYYCERLRSVDIPEHVEYIGNFAFGNCSKLTEVFIPASVSMMGSNVFIACSRLNEIIVDEDNLNYSNDDNGTLFNKEKTVILEYPSGNERESYIIPETVKIISSQAFYNSKLHEISIPNSVTKIEKEAFYSSDKLDKIYIGSNITEMDYTSVFGNCSNLSEIIVSDNNSIFSSDENGVLFDKNKSVLYVYPHGKTDLHYSVPDSVKEISSHAFQQNEFIESVIIPDSTAVIGVMAFYSCKNLSDVSIGKGLETIDIAAFSECDNLENINFPQSLKSINESAFFGCGNLMKINLPDNLNHIGREAFQFTSYQFNEDNWNGEVMYIGSYLIMGYNVEGAYTVKDGTKMIAVGAFNYNGDLTEVTFPNSLNVIDRDAFAFCTKLKSITFSESVSEIRYAAFEHCESLTELILPNNLEFVGSYAFYRCKNLKNVFIPKNIKEINNAAFMGCQKISNAEYDGTKEEWENVIVGEDNECLTDALMFDGEINFIAIVFNSIKSFFSAIVEMFKNLFGINRIIY